MPWSTTEICDGVAHRLGGDEHPGAAVGVVHGVGHQVARPRRRSAPRDPKTSSSWSPRVTRVMSLAAASMALVSTAAATTSSSRTCTGISSGSSPWRRDSSMICWTSRESRSLSVQHPAGEALHGLGVVGGLVDRLGQQPDGADGGLELVAHVGHEVAAHGLDPALAGAVLDQRQHQARAQGGDARDHGAGRRAVAGELHLGLADLAVAAYDVDEVAQVLDEDLVAAHQPEGVRRRGGLEHVVVGVHDHRGGAQHGQHGGHAGRHEGLVDVRQAALLSVADVPGEYGAAGDDRPDDGSQRCLGRRVHVSIVRTSRGHDPPLGAMAPVLCPEFTTRSPQAVGRAPGAT